MTRARRAVAALAATALITLGAVVGGAVRADPAAAAGCHAPSVAVVVDFATLGGGAQRACVPSANASTGLSTLQYAFAVVFAHNEPFVCRINGEPGNDPCRVTSPADKSWSFWTANPGAGGWTYSQIGAGTYRPPPGSAEGWAFGGQRVQPRPTPAEVLPGPAAPRTTPHPTSPPPTSRHSTTTPEHPSGTSVSKPSTTASPRSSGSATPTARTSTFSAKSGMGVLVTEVSRPPAAAKPKGGSPLSTVLGIGVLVVLGGGGWLILRSRRRRRQSEDSGIS